MTKKAEEWTKWKKPQDNENCLNPNKVSLSGSYFSEKQHWLINGVYVSE